MAAVTVGLGDVGTSALSGGSGGSGGGDITSELGSLLSSGYDDAASGSGDAGGAPGGEAGNEPSQPSEGQYDQPGDQQTAQDEAAQAAQPDAQAQAQPDANAEPLPGWKANPDGSYTVASTELPRVQSALKFSEAVGQFFSTPQEAQAGYSQASQMRQMQNDWMYGTDSAIQSVVSFLTGNFCPDPASRMSFARSFDRMLQVAPDVLKTSNPTAYNNLVGSFGSRIYGGLYDKAAQVASQYGADSQPAKDALMEAQAVEWGLTGKYQTELPKFDPQTQARTQFEQQQREFNQRQAAGLQRDVAAFNNSTVEGAKLGQLDQAILAKLAPIKDRFPEVALKDLVAGIHTEVMQTLSQQSDWYTEHRQTFDALINDYRTTWQQGSPGQGLQPRVQAYINDFLARANRILPSIAQKRINAATQARVNTASARSRTNTGQPGQGAGANGQARQNSPQNGNQNGRAQNGERRSDKFDREFNAMFTPFRG